jgi:hypothetical protein
MKQSSTDRPASFIVFPAKAGIQPRIRDWTPAFAGVTKML